MLTWSNSHRLTLVASMLVPTLVLATETFTGDGTVYGGNALGGTCGFSKTWRAWTATSMGLTAALNLPQWNSSLNCGRCVAAQHGSNPAVVIQIVDQCPECKHGDLDFAPDAYAAVTKKSPGREQISWSFVDCPDAFVAGNLEFVMKEGSNNYWAAFQPQNFKRGVEQVEISLPSKGTGWQTLAREESALVGFFFLYQDVIQGSFQLRATSIDGKQTIVSPVIQSIDSSMTCEQQFTSSTSDSSNVSDDQTSAKTQTIFGSDTSTVSGTDTNAQTPTPSSSAVEVPTSTDAPPSPTAAETPTSTDTTLYPNDQLTFSADFASNDETSQLAKVTAAALESVDTPDSVSTSLLFPVTNSTANAPATQTTEATATPSVESTTAEQIDDETMDAQYSVPPVAAAAPAPAPISTHEACEN